VAQLGKGGGGRSDRNLTPGFYPAEKIRSCPFVKVKEEGGKKSLGFDGWNILRRRPFKKKEKEGEGEFTLLKMRKGKG